jgi:hypothetical protein
LIAIALIVVNGNGDGMYGAPKRHRWAMMVAGETTVRWGYGDSALNSRLPQQGILLKPKVSAYPGGRWLFLVCIEDGQGGGFWEISISD